MGINETEVLEVLSVSSSEVEVCGDVAAQPIDREFEFRSDVSVQGHGHLYLLEVISLCFVIKKLLHAFQFLTLPLCEIVFVRGTTVEWQ